MADAVSALSTTIAPLVDWNVRVQSIEEAAAAVPWSAQNLRSCFADGYDNWGIFSADQQLLAFILVHQPLADEWTIMNVAVDPMFQRKGLARRLVEHVVQAADRRQAQLFLEVRESNDAAKALYERVGFSPIGQRKNYYPNSDGSRETAIVMSRAPLKA